MHISNCVSNTFIIHLYLMFFCNKTIRRSHIKTTYLFISSYEYDVVNTHHYEVQLLGL